MYINGDFSRYGAVLHKVKQERVNCVIVYPNWPRYWRCLLDPKAAGALPVRLAFDLPRPNNLCIPGSRVDPTKQRGRPPRYLLKVAVVVWP